MLWLRDPFAVHQRNIHYLQPFHFPFLLIRKAAKASRDVWVWAIMLNAWFRLYTGSPEVAILNHRILYTFCSLANMSYGLRTVTYAGPIDEIMTSSSDPVPWPSIAGPRSSDTTGSDKRDCQQKFFICVWGNMALQWNQSSNPATSVWLNILLLQCSVYRTTLLI